MSRFFKRSVVTFAEPESFKDSLPKGWRKHSGYAPVANEEVHSLMSHEDKDLGLITIKTNDGVQLTMTRAEAELSMAQCLRIYFGYTVKPPH